MMDDLPSVITRSEDETRRLGSLLAGCLPLPSVIGLVGTLGSGKTRLVQGLAEGCGLGPGSVLSPTFVLLHEYPSRPPIFHFDVYRLKRPEEFLELGPEEYFARPGLSVIEWADRVVEYLPPERLDIELLVEAEDSRRVLFHPFGRSYMKAVQDIVSAWQVTQPRPAKPLP